MFELDLYPKEFDIKENAIAYLQELGNKLQDKYIFDEWKIENRFDFKDELVIYKNKNEKISIYVYDPTNNECFENKNRIYGYTWETKKPEYSGYSGIVDKEDIQRWLDHDLTQKENEEIRLF